MSFCPSKSSRNDTPGPEETLRLIPSHISTHDELNAAEQSNISEAKNWAFHKKHQKLAYGYLYSKTS